MPAWIRTSPGIFIAASFSVSRLGIQVIWGEVVIHSCSIFSTGPLLNFTTTLQTLNVVSDVFVHGQLSDSHQ
jgi:hypothetical protein